MTFTMPTLLRPQEKSGYVLSVIDNTVNNASRPKSYVHTGTKHTVHKLVAIFAVLVMAILGVGAGVGAVLAPTSHAKQATAGFNLFDINTWFCPTNDSPVAPLGGTNGLINDAFTGATNDKAGGGFLNVPALGDDVKKTPLEIYGYYAPTFTAWNGIYPGSDKDKAQLWAGTGGKAGVSQKSTPYVYGPTYSINDPLRNPMYVTGGLLCANMGGELNAGIGNAISYLPKLMVAISSEVYDWATTTTLTDKDSALYPVAQGVETLIVGTAGQKGLKDLLFLDFLTPMVLVATFWFILQGLIRRRSMEAAQGALWMICASICALLFLSAPLKVAEGIDNVVSTVNTAIVGAINDTGNTGDYCSLPDGADKKDVRVIKCSLWYSLIYVPWVNGQFGYNQYNLPAAAKSDVVTEGKFKSIAAGSSSKPEGEGWQDIDNLTAGSLKASRGVLVEGSYEDKYKITNTAAMLNWPYYQMHIQAQYEPYIGLNYSEIAFNQVAMNGNKQWKDAGNAIGSSFSGLIAAIAPIIVLMSLSLTILAYQVMMLLLIAFSPLFFLLGVAPGWGRRIAMRWVELTLGLLVKRIMLVLFLAIYLRLLMTVLSIGSMNWLLQMTLVAIISVVALTQRGTFVDMVSDAIDFGGDKRIGDDGQVKALAQRATKSAYQKTSGVVRRGASAGGAAAAEGTKKVASSVNSRVRSGRDVNDKNAKKDANLGIATVDKKGNPVKGARGPLDSLKNVKDASQIDVTRLNKKELQKISNADGTLNTKRADKWLDRRKSEHVAEQQSINNDYRDNLKARKEIQKSRVSAFEKNRQLDENRRAREEIRKRQAAQNKEIQRVFGKKEDDKKANSQHKGPLATEYKAPKPYRNPRPIRGRRY